MLVALTAAAAQATEGYYVVFFAAQTPDNQAKFAHTFAAFVRVDDIRAKSPAIQAAVISWLPANGNVRVVKLRPEPGKNFGLKETLNWAAELRLNVSAFGPYPIRKELYDSAVRQVKMLESGVVAYKAVDVARGNPVSNCIHALSDLDIVKEPLMTGAAHGEEATALVVRFFRPWMVQGPPAPWLLDRLGLRNFKIAMRTLDSPTR
jgi:hypothetical protein